MNIAITGALGHIGSYIIRKIPNYNNINKIYLIDNFQSQRYHSIFNLKKIKYILCEYDLSIDKIKEKDIDVIFHFAAKTDAAQSHINLKEFKKNYLITKNLVNYCKNKKTKIIFASSTSVYGSQNKIVNENCNKSELKPQSPYAKIKLREEKFIKNNMKKNKFVILRLGTIFGYSPGIRFHTAVNKFCYQASLGYPLTVWKTAMNQKRPYLSLHDLNKTLKFIINNPKKMFIGDIFNIVSLNATVFDIINIIKKYKKVKIVFVKHKIMNQLSYEVSVKKINDKGLILKSNFTKYIKETINKFTYLESNFK